MQNTSSFEWYWIAFVPQTNYWPIGFVLTYNLITFLYEQQNALIKHSKSLKAIDLPICLLNEPFQIDLVCICR